jgi:hypothetical protein
MWIEKKQKPRYTQVFALFADFLNFRIPRKIILQEFRMLSKLYTG